MSAAGEVQVGITVCLDAITQAFRDGEAIIEKIKKKRSQKRAPPPPRLLEDSIGQAPWEIGREKKRGIARFGKAFEDGDHIAVIALQQITIELQRSLLDKLKNAAFDDEHKITDFNYLVDAADTGRDRTIAALHELRQRLINAQRSQDEPAKQEPSVTTTSANSSASNVTTPPTADKNGDSLTASQLKLPATKIKSRGRELTSSRDASGEEDAVSGAEPTTKDTHRKSSLLGFLKNRRRTNSSSEARAEKSVTSQTIAEENTSPTTVPFRPPPHCDASDATDGASTPARPQSGAPQFRYEEWEDKSEEIWSRRSVDRHQSMAVAPDQQSDRTASTANINFPLNPPSPVLTTRTNSNPHNHAGSTAVPIPNPDNEFLGFCKGAVKLQNGDRKGSFHKCKEVEPWSRHPSSHASAAQYLACQQQRCAFRSSFAHKDTEIIWKRVFTLESKGMKVRWQFLAKSHVLQRVVVKHQYSFKCLFCVFQGLKSGVYHGMDYYLEHIASEHRGKPLNDVILYKTGCINDRVATNDDEFDINLWPTTALTGTNADKGQPEWMSDDLMDPAKEANDSMFNEPWNEGLSDFHYGAGQFEEAEYLRD